MRVYMHIYIDIITTTLHLTFSTDIELCLIFRFVTHNVIISMIILFTSSDIIVFMSLSAVDTYKFIEIFNYLAICEKCSTRFT